MDRILKIGMDVHSTNYTLCAVESRFGKEDHVLANISVGPDYKLIVDFINKIKLRMDPQSKDNIDVECGYEAGCLGYSLYYQLKGCKVRCTVLAPTTMLTEKGSRIKTDHRDARNIAFCLSLKLPELIRETLNEYLATYEDLTNKIARYDKRIQEIASQNEYQEDVRKLECFLGIKTHAALSLIVETGDFKRFSKGNIYASYLGLAPGEHSSGESTGRLGITKAGNSHLRRLLIEAAEGICKGSIGHKSKSLAARQKGNPEDVISYADKANIRLRSKYYRLIRHGKKRNIAVTAIARELACFVWGMMTDHIHGKEA